VDFIKNEFTGSSVFVLKITVIYLYFKLLISAEILYNIGIGMLYYIQEINHKETNINLNFTWFDSL
jgi:hypothetical protein